MEDIINELISIVKKAGEEVLEVYDRADHGVEYKDDKSPLTEADKRSNDVIIEGLKRIAPLVPVISEENKEVPFNERKDWDKFWLVDPLDGTKEFINRNGEFTLNIALLEKKRPVLGIVYVPVKGIIFVGEKGKGAKKIDVSTGSEEEISICKGPGEEKLKAVASRSHINEETKNVVESLNADMVSAGSSLKFTLVASGEAHFYPRLGPTWEWDTAAGHAVAESAGAIVTDLEGNDLEYNKEVLKHKGFIVSMPGLIDRVVKEVKRALN